MVDSARAEDEHPGLARLPAVARECGIWLLIGSLHIRLGDGRLANPNPHRDGHHREGL